VLLLEQVERAQTLRRTAQFLNNRKQSPPLKGFGNQAVSNPLILMQESITLPKLSQEGCTDSHRRGGNEIGVRPFGRAPVYLARMMPYGSEAKAALTMMRSKIKKDW
jgi:hypothetical protein